MAVTTPGTLQEAMVHFSDPQVCHDYLTRPYGGVKCPRCGSYRVRVMGSRKKWKCYGKHARPQFSIKTGTIFEESPIGLDKRLVAVWLIVNAKNGTGTSARERTGIGSTGRSTRSSESASSTRS